jgi:hypothetical protein
MEKMRTYKNIYLLIHGILLTSLSQAEETKLLFNARLIKEVQINNPNGNLEIVASPNEEAIVYYNSDFLSPSCDLSAKQKIHKLNITVSSKTKEEFKTSQCKVNIKLEVPINVDIDYKIDEGDSFIQGTRGKIKANIGSGEVRINAEVSNFEGEFLNSNITVIGFTGNAKLKVNAGNVKVTYKTVPNKGAFSLLNEAGNLGLFLPVGSAVQHFIETLHGTTSSAVNSNTSSKFSIDMRTKSGNIEIRNF